MTKAAAGICWLDKFFDFQDSNLIRKQSCLLKIYWVVDGDYSGSITDSIKERLFYLQDDGIM